MFKVLVGGTLFQLFSFAFRPNPTQLNATTFLHSLIDTMQRLVAETKGRVSEEEWLAAKHALKAVQGEKLCVALPTAGVQQ